MNSRTRSTVAFVCALALMAFAVCGVGMLCMEMFAHYDVLATSSPVPALVIAILALCAIALTSGAILVTDFIVVTPAQSTRHGPPFPIGLELAFSDGILHTKRY